MRCASLRSAIFLGDAPTAYGSPFVDPAEDFTVYFLGCREGFSTPEWEGHPAIMLEEAGCPAASWLVNHDLPYDADLGQDLNGDGVSLLMAYALDLDPNEKLQFRLPAPVMKSDSLSLSFFAATRGVTYTVETSEDLVNWTTEGVMFSEPDEGSRRTASVPADSPMRCLRLVVEMR